MTRSVILTSTWAASDGAQDEGICGRPWETWGVERACPCGDSDDSSGGGSESASDADAEDSRRVPLYTRDGFERVELEAIRCAVGVRVRVRVRVRVSAGPREECARVRVATEAKGSCLL